MNIISMRKGFKPVIKARRGFNPSTLSVWGLQCHHSQNNSGDTSSSLALLPARCAHARYTCNNDATLIFGGEKILTLFPGRGRG